MQYQRGVSPLLVVLLAVPITLLVLIGLQQVISPAPEATPTRPIPATSLVGIIPAQKRATAADIIISPPTSTPIPAGKPAPDFSLVGLDGTSHSLQDYLGKGVILNFWATWCVPCRVEMPLLETTYHRLNSADIVIIGMNLREDRAAVQQYVDELNITFPILLDTDGFAAYEYGVIGLPTTYFVDSKGKIRDRYIGALTAVSLQQYLDRLSS